MMVVSETYITLLDLILPKAALKWYDMCTLKQNPINLNNHNSRVQTSNLFKMLQFNLSTNKTQPLKYKHPVHPVSRQSRHFVIWHTGFSLQSSWYKTRCKIYQFFISSHKIYGRNGFEMSEIRTHHENNDRTNIKFNVIFSYVDFLDPVSWEP